MTDEDEPVAEIWAKGAWQPIDIGLAVRMPSSRIMRCLECGGRVRAHREGSNGQRPHMEHYERHKGCSRGDCFDGSSRPHHRQQT